MENIMYIMLFILIHTSISLFNFTYIHMKEKNLPLKFYKKLKIKGYKRTNDNFNLVSLIANQVINRDKYAVRMFYSLFPITNLYLFGSILSKRINQEYNTILDSLDNQEVLEYLENNKYIYNQNTISKRKNILNEKIDEITNVSSDFIEICKNDSLEMLDQKKQLLEEMIYLNQIKEMTKKDNQEAKGIGGGSVDPYKLGRWLKK